MEHIKAKGRRKSIPKANADQHKESSSKKEEPNQRQGLDASVGAALFGISSDSLLNRVARQDIKASLINLKFYFESACLDIQRIVNTIDRVERAEEEKIRGDEKICKMN